MDRREAWNALNPLIADNAQHLNFNVAINGQMASLNKDNESFKQHTVDMLGSGIGHEIARRLPVKIEHRPATFGAFAHPLDEVHTMEAIVFSKDQWTAFKEGVMALLQQQ